MRIFNSGGGGGGYGGVQSALFSVIFANIFLHQVKLKITDMWRFNKYVIAAVDQGFLKRKAPPIIWPHFAENCMKGKKFDRDGEAHVQNFTGRSAT